MNTLLLKIIFLAISISSFNSCGSNVFEGTGEDAQPLDAATRSLEEQTPQKAIDIILGELGSDAKNLVNSTNDASLSDQLFALVSAKKDYEKLLSVLSAGYAQLGGLDPIDVFLNMADGKDESGTQDQTQEGRNNGITALFPIMPEATAQNIMNVDKALFIMNAIPAELHTSADKFKTALLLTGSFTLKLKALDTDGDGQISLDEAGTLDAASAASIVASLGYAISSLGEYGEGQEANKGLEAMSEKLEKIQTGIEGAEGEDAANKLAQYITR